MARKKKDDLEKVAEKIEMSMTFNPLMNALRANDKRNLFNSNVLTYFHKTGFPLFDYYFGSVINVHDELGAIIRQDPMIGQCNGVFNMIVGDSGSGKTTIAIQIATNIVRRYRNGTVQHYDCENRLTRTRVEILTGLAPKDFDEGGKYNIISGTNTTLEDMQEAIVRIYSEKMKMKDEILVKTGTMDEDGKEILVMEPTVIIIDSIANLISNTFSFNNERDVLKATELRGNTEGARDAKTIRGFLKEVLPLCKVANIIIFAINHVNDNMSMNSFTGPKRQQNYLSQDEAIPGGKALRYNSFNIVKLIAHTGVSDAYTEEADGFAGYPVTFEPVKCSTNQSGNTRFGKSFDMVFSQKQGFDSLRSLILYGRDKGIIEGNKPKLKFKDDNSFTFSWKNIHKEKNEKPIWDCVRNFIIPDLESQLAFVEPDEQIFDERLLDY